MKNNRPKKVTVGNWDLIPCPTCGNEDDAQIIWDDPDGGADFVTCVVCGTRYNPATGEFQPPF